MSHTVDSSETKKMFIGKTAGTAAVIEIECDSTIARVDELIRPSDVREFLAPGFIDIQVNGFAGVDYNDPAASCESIAESVRVLFQTGVTRFFPTIITGSQERIIAAVRNLTAAKSEFMRNAMPEGQAIQAFHIEGPHLSPETGPRGAHPLQHIRAPSFEEFQRWQDAADGNVRLVTISPEWQETPSYVRRVIRAGVVVSIGHTNATVEQIQAAVDAGATMSTHLGNAAHAMLPKTQNYIWEQLAEDRLAASFIVDGIHIPGAFFRAAVRAKGVERTILVTDAVMPAMCQPGPYKLGEVDVELHPDGSVMMRGETRLAGSALCMDRAIGNAVRFGRISLRDAIVMATVNPARVARIAGRQRGLSPGEKADLVRFRFDEASSSLQVVQTVVAGTTVYSRRN